MATMPQLLKILIERGATDLHLTTGSPPQIRIDGRLYPLEMDPLTAKETKQLGYSVLTDAQKHQFEENKELDFSFGVRNLARFRANIYNQRGATALAIRTIPYEIRSFEQLGLPKVIAEFAHYPKGLVLVTGPTGSGKSTTLAAIINKINEERHDHIVTIEDPIEYLHQHKNCVVNQREVGSDTKSFAAALRSVLRQDPDVILVGEMRDLETIEMAVRASETGHLTFATLHTNSSAETINRIIDVFPASQQPQIRAQLSFVLQGVVCQSLLPKLGGKGRVLAMEVMVPNNAIRNLIREDKIHQIYSSMQAGQGKTGMVTFNQSLYDLAVRRQISIQEAMARSHKPEELEQMFNRLDGGTMAQSSPSRSRR